MIIYTILAIVLLVVTPFVAMTIIRLFKLSRFGLKFPDLTLPIYAVEMIWLSGRFIANSLLFQYLLILSLLAIFLALRLSRRKRVLNYRRWLKLFWRISFLVTSLFFVVTIILSLFM